MENAALPVSVRDALKTAAWIALPACAGEAVQHAIEFIEGMYVRGDGIALGRETQLRNIAIAIKIAGFLASTLWARSTLSRLHFFQSLTVQSKSMFVVLPLVAHYIVNYAIVGRSDVIVILGLLVDCAIIGWLATSIGAVLPSRRSARP